MSADEPAREIASGRIRYAAVPLAILSAVEIAAFAPLREIASPRIWLVQAAGAVALVFVVCLLGEIIRRFTPRRRRHPASAAELSLAIAILLVAFAHTWIPLQTRWERLFPGLRGGFGVAVFICALAAGYAGARAISRRLGVESPRLLAVAVAGVAVLIGIGGAVRSAVEAGALAALRVPILASGGAVLIATCAIGSISRRWYPLLIGLPVVAGLIAMRALVGSEDGWAELAPAPERPTESAPVVFIVLDTFRADALDLRNPAVSNTPSLARLAEVSDVFPDAIANASWTLPGHASLFTGMTLSRHRTDRTSEPGFNPSLPPELLTSHQLFARHGYRTICIVANGIVGMGTELARGCQRYNNPSRHWLTRLTPLGLLSLVGDSPFAFQQLLLELTGLDVNSNADEIVDLALPELSGEPRGIYLLLNFLDVHGPIYRTDGLAIPSIRSRLSMRRDLVLRLFGLLSEAELWTRHRETLRAYYDSETRWLDQELGRLLTALEERGWFDEVMIVVTSDHGEAFSENPELYSYFSHHSAYEPAVRIPLIVKHPGQSRGSRPVRRAQQVDVLPTLLDMVGLPHVEGLDGRSVTAPASGPAITEWYRRLEGESFPYLPHNRIGLYHDRFKYVIEGDGSEHLFDLDRSPYEEVDVLQQNRELAAELRSQAEELTKRPELDPSRLAKPIDPRVLDQLRALGYAK
jgi:arylsulfatase A-like enzyme